MELLDNWEALWEIAHRVFEKTGEAAPMVNLRTAISVLKDTVPLTLLTNMQVLEEEINAVTEQATHS